MKRLSFLILCAILCFVTVGAFAATRGEQNALMSAKNYLSFTAFSYKGLIKQLEYEGYSSSESKYAADNCGADWFDQAAKKASQYMSFTSMSKVRLIKQLEYDGFTTKEAEYGASVEYGENPRKPSQTASINTTANTDQEVTSWKVVKDGSTYKLTDLSNEDLYALLEQINQELADRGN